MVVKEIILTNESSENESYSKKWVSEDPDNRVRIDVDELLKMIYNTTNVDGAKVWFVNNIKHRILKYLMFCTKDIIVNETNFNNIEICTYKNLIENFNEREHEECKYKITLKDLNISTNQILRNSKISNDLKRLLEL